MGSARRSALRPTRPTPSSAAARIRAVTRRRAVAIRDAPLPRTGRVGPHRARCAVPDWLNVGARLPARIFLSDSGPQSSLRSKRSTGGAGCGTCGSGGTFFTAPTPVAGVYLQGAGRVNHVQIAPGDPTFMTTRPPAGSSPFAAPTICRTLLLAALFGTAMACSQQSPGGPGGNGGSNTTGGSGGRGGRGGSGSGGSGGSTTGGSGGGTTGGTGGNTTGGSGGGGGSGGSGGAGGSGGSAGDGGVSEAGPDRGRRRDGVGGEHRRDTPGVRCPRT